MKRNKNILIIALVLIASCLTKINAGENYNSLKVRFDTFKLFDKARQREIPVAIYRLKNKKDHNRKIIIFSHGYAHNRGGANLDYSYLTNYLAEKGYFVISIQHELSTDSLLPLTGNPQVLRRPFWERGADNILFVINELKTTHPDMDFRHITLIGHSNGGDMTSLFPQKYPGIADKIITLDNRRMALPVTNYPKVYSLRSSDQVADEGVLPTIEDQKKFSIKIIKLPNTIHNDMSDNATNIQRDEIRQYIMSFLTEK